MTITDTRPATESELLFGFLNLLQHIDGKVRAAALQQLIAAGMRLSQDERRTIFERHDWPTVYPDLDVAIAYFYTPKPEVDDDAIAANTYTVRQWSSITPRVLPEPRTWPAWFWVMCGACGLIVLIILAAGIVAIVIR